MYKAIVDQLLNHVNVIRWERKFYSEEQEYMLKSILFGYRWSMHLGLDAMIQKSIYHIEFSRFGDIVYDDLSLIEELNNITEENFEHIKIEMQLKGRLL